MRLLEVEIPMALPSVANLREHWSKRAKRTKAQRDFVTLALKSNDRRPFVNECWGALIRGQTLKVMLTRVAPRKLDTDNLSSAFKGVRDSVAYALGVDDGEDRVEWTYGQEKGPPGIRIEVTAWPQESIVAAGTSPNFDELKDPVDHHMISDSTKAWA